jgi:hypothetical protein
MRERDARCSKNETKGAKEVSDESSVPETPGWFGLSYSFMFFSIQNTRSSANKTGGLNEGASFNAPKRL